MGGQVRLAVARQGREGSWRGRGALEQLSGAAKESEGGGGQGLHCPRATHQIKTSASYFRVDFLSADLKCWTFWRKREGGKAGKADRCLGRLAEGKRRCFAGTNRTNRSARKTVVGLVGQGNRGSRISKVVV